MPDSDVNRFLKLFTELPILEIENLTKSGGASLNAAKIVLADEATKILHGEECLVRIHKTIGSIYSGDSKTDISSDDNEDDIFDALPTVTFTNADILKTGERESSESAGVDIGTALMLCRLSRSRKEGRRLVQAGGVKVNDVKVTDEYLVLDKQYFLNKSRVKLSVGKKRHVALCVPDDVWEKSNSAVAEAEGLEELVQDDLEDTQTSLKRVNLKSSEASKAKTVTSETSNGQDNEVGTNSKKVTKRRKTKSATEKK